MSELINPNDPSKGELISGRPSYLSGREPPIDKLAQASEHVRPPRVKFIQALTGEPYKPLYQEGQAILVPQMKLLCDRQTPMSFTILYFYVEYCCFNDINNRGQEPYVLERTLDKNSSIAKKCEIYSDEPHPQGKGTVHYRKVYTFITLLHDVPEIKDMPVIMAFKSGQAGPKILVLWQARRADWFACRFRGVVFQEPGKKNKWWSLAPDNDPVPFVDEADFFRYEKMAKYYEDLVVSRVLEADYDDTDIETGDASKETKF